MMSQQYSLRWNNHQPNFISMFTTLLNTQTLVDVTLAAEGRHLQAHKVVLSACSTYFQSLFVDNPSRHPIVILKDVTFADLRTMVDFMYYGEVNVTEEQLPKVLDTAKLLKIKGLTEMPDSTSLTRSQTTSSDLQSQSDTPMDPPRHPASPSMSPSSRRKRFVRRKSSSSSTVHAATDDVKIDASAQTDLARGDSITLSSLPLQQRRSVDAAQQTTEQTHLAGIEPMPLDAATNPLQEPSQPAGDIPNRKRQLKRQHRVMNPMAFGTRPINELLAVPGPPVSPTTTGTSASPASTSTSATPASSDSIESSSMPISSLPHMMQTHESSHQDTAPMVGMPGQVSHSASGNRPISKQLSAPPLSAPQPFASPASAAAPESYSSHTLRRHESFPQDATAQVRMQDRVGYMAPGTRSSRHRQSSTTANYRASHTSQRHVLLPEDAVAQNSGQRAMHTPSMRPGPQLSCNYCWNTVGDNGRVLRRKTQFHCPECRTNLCIVPCFHEYHDGLSQQRAADNAR